MAMTMREIQKFDDFIWGIIFRCAKHTSMASLKQLADYINKNYPDEWFGEVDKNQIDRSFKRMTETGRINRTTDGKYTYTTALQTVYMFDFTDNSFFVDEKPKKVESIAIRIYNYFIDNGKIGKSHPVPMKWLANHFDVDERALRRIIERINFRGYTFPDGSTFKYKIMGDVGRGGYFMVESVEEAFTHISWYEQKIYQASRKARILREDYGVHNQIMAKLEEVEDDLKDGYIQQMETMKTLGEEELNKRYYEVGKNPITPPENLKF